LNLSSFEPQFQRPGNPFPKINPETIGIIPQSFISWYYVCFFDRIKLKQGITGSHYNFRVIYFMGEPDRIFSMDLHNGDHQPKSKSHKVFSPGGIVEPAGNYFLSRVLRLQSQPKCA
jgi:hypothetical protein